MFFSLFFFDFCSVQKKIFLVEGGGGFGAEKI
jgi:hypothetical protein